MKAFLVSCFTVALLLASAPLSAESWADRLVNWFSGLFGSSDTAAREITYTTAQLDSLRQSPAGLLVSALPDSDTLAVAYNWPYESLDVATTLTKEDRLRRETALLTDPVGKLPLVDVAAIRVIYRADQRPTYFLDQARRFADVQEIAYDEVIDQVLPFGLELPTVIIAEDAPDASRFNADWYTTLYDLNVDDVTFLHFGETALLGDLPANWSVLNAPARHREVEAYLAQVIFGAETLTGRLTKASPRFAAGTGYDLTAVRGGFRLPEYLGVDRTKFERVDYHINRGIRYRAMPGAQLLVMKDGQVIYEKAYGHHTYRKQAVNPGDLYDLASVTKAAATTLAVMKLYDQGRIDLQAQVRTYLPELKKKIIGRYKIERLLAHHTGLQSDLPLFDFIGKRYVAPEERDAFTLPVGPERFLDENVPAKIRKKLKGKIGRTRRQVYRYSDLNYYLLQLAVEEITGESLADFLQREFYAPLRLGRLGYRPAGKFPERQTVPTVRDEWMRGGLLRGYVHDEGAALLGGVAGHAGLFANAHDLGRLFQLLLDEGRAGDQQLLSPETVALFTKRSRFNYRALGFDRLVGGYGGVVQAGASKATFGHLGFSGTAVWADPDNDLVFVLLTNRIHPDPKNERFQQMNIRLKTHREVYRALNSWSPAS